MNGLVKEGSLGAILYNCQIITEDDIRQALEEQQASGCRFGEALVRLGIVTQEDIDWALSNQLNIPYVRLTAAMIDPEVVRLVPAAVARRTNLMPLIRVGDELTVAIADPLNLAAIAEVEQLTGCQVEVSVALIREIREMQDRFYGPVEAGESLGFEASSFPPEALAKINADLSGGKLIDYLLLNMLQNRLQLITIQPRGDRVVVLGRREGGVKEIGSLAAIYYPDLLVRLKRLAKVHGNKPANQGALGYGYRGAKLSFQAHFLQGAAGTCVTLKKQITGPVAERLSDLALAGEKRQKILELARAGSGLVLFAMHDHLERGRFIDLFLEECGTGGRTVVVMGDGVGAGAPLRISPQAVNSGELPDLLLATLEHAPDIIVVEDASDGQLLVAAAKAALRGKLVLAGMPVNDPTVVFRHLLHLRHRHLFVPRALRGIVAARVVTKLCPACRERYRPTREELAALQLNEPLPELFRPTGCGECDQTGYAGREYLVDVIPFDAGLLTAFEGARESEELERYLKENGHRGCREEAQSLLAAGELAPVEYLTAILL